jgi:acyl-CoA synthetase (AMP-forming)/AMP-acid ligase II
MNANDRHPFETNLDRHPDGAIEIKDRSKDIIMSGGENMLREQAGAL